jgi:hypothetical protein
MRNLSYIIITIFIVSGCGARAELNRRFANIVYFNGINEYEAVAIAELRLVHSPYCSFFKKVPARVRTDKDAQQYPKYWFVDFTQKLMPDAPGFLVVIDRDTGEIKLATEYFSRKIPNLEGIVSRAEAKSTP